MINDKLNVAVIGVGYWGKKVATEYSLLSKKESSVKLVGVCDSFDSNLDFCRDSLGIAYQTKQLNDILENQDIDAVHICTPSETHYEICKAALEHGKHVTVEKPMTLNSLEAMKLVDLAHERGRILSVGHIFRFDASIEKAKELIAEGWFGDLYWMKLTWTDLAPLMLGRDIITDLAPHPFDIINFLTDEWPTKITCVAKAHRKSQKEETAFISSQFKSDIIVSIEISWLNPQRRREVQIMGSNGYAKIDCINQQIEGYQKGQFFNIPVERSNTIHSEITHFVKCISDQKTSDPGFINKNNGLVGANVVKLLEITKAAMNSEKTELVR
jgi:UDP-N-acetylglucosamine 3-dehydrogenase